MLHWLLTLGALASSKMHGHRLRSPEAANVGHCAGGLCAGLAHYPVGPGNRFYAEFDVPKLPEDVDTSLTFYIYFNIFFGDVKPGKMNQFVPQLMLGEPLCDSSGPPLYKPIWHPHSTWVFGSQYFFEIFNDTSNQTEGHAATGDLFNCTEGEVLWTEFTLSADWKWTLNMGVLGDTKRTSSVVAEKPYMGLLPAATKSWKDDVFNKTFVGSCWELYGIKDGSTYPASGSNYTHIFSTENPGSIKWLTDWKEDEVPTCPGHPSSLITETHDAGQEVVLWNITMPEDSNSPVIA